MGLDRNPSQETMAIVDDTQIKRAPTINTMSSPSAALMRSPTQATINSIKNVSAPTINFNGETPRNLDKSPSQMPVLASNRADSPKILRPQHSELDAEERKIQELRRIKHESQANLAVPAGQNVRGSIQSSQADAWGHHGGQSKQPVGPQKFDEDSGSENDPLENDDLRRSIPGNPTIVKPAQATVKAMEYKQVKSSPRNILDPNLR